MLSARALCKTPAKRRFIWQRSTLPVIGFVSKPSFSMDTSNKIRVVDQDPLRIKRIDSGGVRDPSDPKHYPKLGGIEGAVSPASSPRTLSTYGSFKDTLMSPPAVPDLLNGAGKQGSPAASPSYAAPSSTGLQRTRTTADETDALATGSPRIAASRHVQGDETGQGGVGGAGYVGSSAPSQQVS